MQWTQVYINSYNKKTKREKRLSQGDDKTGWVHRWINISEDITDRIKLARQAEEYTRLAEVQKTFLDTTRDSMSVCEWTRRLEII